MTIHEHLAKIKHCVREALSGEIYVVLLIVLVGFGGFGLGWLSVITTAKEPVQIIGDSVAAAPDAQMIESDGLPAIGGAFVVSKNGTKYHLPWCSGALRIKEENKIWFDSKEEAERAGYTPAANCKGL